MRSTSRLKQTVLRGSAPLLALAILGIISGGQRAVSGTPAFAQGSPSLINVEFGPTEIWMPSQDAITALHQCVNTSFTCVQQVMQKDGASDDAIAFYRLTAWFLSDIQDTGTIQFATVFNPWRANENSQPALLGGIPPVALPEQDAGRDNFESTVEHAIAYAGLKAAYPNVTFWGPGPTLESMDTLPDGGQRFIFDYRLLDGCHACAIVGTARFAFDFAPDGTNEGTRFLGIGPAPTAGT